MIAPQDHTPTGLVGRFLHSARVSLFYSPLGTAMTLVYIVVLLSVVPRIIDWAFVDANFEGDSRSSCTGGGACWVFMKVYIGQLLYGQYPLSERWRIYVAGGALVGACALCIIKPHRAPWSPVIALSCGCVLAAVIFMLGGILGLRSVPVDDWGGLSLNFVIWVVTASGSIPLGIVLALGRRSKLPIVRLLSVAYIEVLRGVPLVTVLFAAAIMVPLFLPQGLDTPNLLRALISLTLFYAAYQAEVVRGGLQAVDKGQYEAAHALGLSYWRTMALVILPQALRAVLPGIVNTLIDILKDTSLVTIIGLADVLGIAKRASNDPVWLGLSAENYVFVGLVFFIMCYAMSAFGRRLEQKAQH